MTATTRATLRPLHRATLDPTLPPVLGSVVAALPPACRERAEAALAAFCAWIAAQDAEFVDYDEAFARYERAVAGTSAGTTLPAVQLLLVALDERGPLGDQHRPAHARPRSVSDGILRAA